MLPFIRRTALILSFVGLGTCAQQSSDQGPEIVGLDEASAHDPDVSASGPAGGSGDSADGAALDRPPAELVGRGETAFNTGFCFKCHQEGGTGGDRAPNLTDSQWVQCDGTVEGIASVIRSGVPKDKLSRPDYPFAMNSAARMNLSDDMVEALAAYVWSLSH